MFKKRLFFEIYITLGKLENLKINLFDSLKKIHSFSFIVQIYTNT